jgi:hypothetical protein
VETGESRKDTVFFGLSINVTEINIVTNATYGFIRNMIVMRLVNNGLA